MEKLRALKIPSEIMGSEPYSIDNLRHLTEYLSDRFKEAVKIFDEIVKYAKSQGYYLIFYKLDDNVFAKCLKCGKWLWGVEEMKVHLAEHEGFEYISPLNAFIEVEKIEEAGIYKCKICESRFISKRDALTHIEAVHKSKNNVKREPKDEEIVEFRVKDGLPEWILEHEIDLGNNKKVRIGAKKIHELPYRIAKIMEYYGFGEVIG